MSRPGLATRQDLLRWADSTGARTALPRLIRRLVLETGVGVLAVDFPADEGTAAGGFDGVARTTGSTPFLSDGLSVWELSVKKAYSKADDDYVKRTATPDGSPLTEVTYVQVILRPWTDRQRFATAKTDEGRWRQVRAYGVDDVLAWLEAAPVTHAWLSEELGLKPYGMRTVDAWWRNWAKATMPELSEQVVLAGRAAEAKSLADRLGGGHGITTVLADSREEALAFVAASLRLDDASGSSSLLSRTVLVDDLETWRSHIEQERTLVLIPLTPEVVAEAHSVENHHVVVPLASAAQADVELPPIDHGLAAAELSRLGVPADKADDAARLARRSLIALRRHVAVKPELHTPAWSTEPTRFHRAVLMVGSWQDSEGDLKILGELAGMSEDDLRERIDEVVVGEDPFIDALDASWALVSQSDAWQFLHTRIRPDDLRRLREVVKTVLLEADPFHGLTESERLGAQIDGIRRAYSAALRRGLCTTVAILGARGAVIDLERGATGAQWAGAVVRTLLENANEAGDISVWAGLAQELPLLAEAAPEDFSAAARAGLAGETPLLGGIFTDSSDTSALFGPHSPHSSLLWALEILAWSSAHFGAAVDLLARLDELDPGGNLANRPFSSLVSIFRPGHPETSASVDGRLSAIDGLRQRHPGVAWRLMVRLMPGLHGVHHPTSGPRFRDWKPPSQSVPVADYVRFVGEVSDRLRADAGTDAAKWGEVLEASNQLTPEQRESTRRDLRDLAASGALDEDGRLAVWQILRKLIANHREFSEAKWALPAGELDALAEVALLLEPSDAASAGAWLFAEHRPDLGTGEIQAHDFRGYEAELGRRRAEAVATIERQEGLGRVLALAADSVVPAEVGAALATATAETHASEVLPLFDSENASEADVAAGWTWKRFRDSGWDAVQSLISDTSTTPSQKAGLLNATRDFPRAWETAATLGSEVTQAFWERCAPFGAWDDPKSVADATSGLLSVGRAGAALDFLSLAIHGSEDDPEFAPLVVDALEHLLQSQSEDSDLHRLQQYHFTALFSYLERHRDVAGRATISRLEWAYLPALGFDPVVPSLHQALADDPTFFADIMRIVYRSRTGDSENDDQRHESLAQNGYSLLSSWRVVPGVKDGEIDAAVLNSWVDTVLALLRDEDRLEVGEMQVGHMLASAPADKDGSRPPEVVRNLLERLANDRIDESLAVELLNRRGVTSRDPEAGGEHERALARDFEARATAAADRWPRTATILRRLAEDYDADARRQDAEAERRRRGYER